MKRGPRINSPVSEVPHHTTFDEFWQREDELWEISLKESFRQRDERKKRLNEKSGNKPGAKVHEKSRNI